MEFNPRNPKHHGTPHPQKQCSPEGDAGGIKVVVRARPSNEHELGRKQSQACFKADSQKTCTLHVQGGRDSHRFGFDHVLDQQASQSDVFNAVGISAVEDVLSGLNSTILAYGRTGSGKTHTMLGDLDSEEMRGVAPRMFEYLFSRIAEEQRTMASVREYRILCSSLEIYNESITDLLKPGSTNLALRIGSGAGTYVECLSQVEIKSMSDALKVLGTAANSRRESLTNANQTSSRSHFVFSCFISKLQKEEDGSAVARSTRLDLVDLAGSESAKASDGEHIKTLSERNNINKSMTCFGRVVDALTASQGKGSKNAHVPYRDSKLTTLLQESLGGNVKTTIIAAISAMPSASRESLCTLGFVERAKRIKNRVKANESTVLGAARSGQQMLKCGGSQDYKLAVRNEL